MELSKIKTLLEEEKTDRVALKTDIENMKITKTTLENDNMSKVEDVKEVNTKINNLNTLIEEETKARKYYNHVSKQKFSQLESNMTDIVTKNSNPDLEILEKKISMLESTTIELKEHLTYQPDPEVVTHDNITIESSYHDSASHSVQNIKQEPEVEPDNQYPSIKVQNNILTSTSESQVSKDNSEKIEVIN